MCIAIQWIIITFYDLEFLLNSSLYAHYHKVIQSPYIPLKTATISVRAMLTRIILLAVIYFLNHNYTLAINERNRWVTSPSLADRKEDIQNHTNNGACTPFCAQERSARIRVSVNTDAGCTLCSFGGHHSHLLCSTLTTLLECTQHCAWCAYSRRKGNSNSVYNIVELKTAGL